MVTGVWLQVSRYFVLRHSLPLLVQVPVWHWPLACFALLRAVAQWRGSLYASEMPIH